MPVSKATVVRHRQLHLTPATLGEAIGEYDDHLSTPLNALNDVFADLSAGHPVSLMKAQSVMTFRLESWQQTSDDPDSVIAVVGHEGIIDIAVAVSQFRVATAS